MVLKRGIVLAVCVLALLAIYVGIKAFAPADERFPGGLMDAGGDGAQAVSHDLPGDSAARPSSAHSQTPTETLVLALEGDGLRLFDAASGSARPLSFGMARDPMRSLLTTPLSLAPLEEGFSSECNNSFMRLENGLTIWFVKDAFAGWAVRGPAPTLTTASGIGIGSSRAELEGVYDVSIFRSTLGVEFTAGGLAGLLESDLPEAPITHLWAGQTCIAR